MRDAQALMVTAPERDRGRVLVTVLVRRWVMSEVTRMVVVGSGVLLLLLLLLLKTSRLLVANVSTGAGSGLLLGSSAELLPMVGSGALLLYAGRGRLLIY